MRCLKGELVIKMADEEIGYETLDLIIWQWPGSCEYRH
jgi:hypothetical protein